MKVTLYNNKPIASSTYFLFLHLHFHGMNFTWQNSSCEEESKVLIREDDYKLF